MFKKLMIRLYEYLEKKLDIVNHSSIIINPEINNILSDITLLIQKQELMPDVNGEFKRHRVYTIAMKRYPTMRKRDISLAIEIVMQRLK